jgi:hypothetical protein
VYYKVFEESGTSLVEQEPHREFIAEESHDRGNIEARIAELERAAEAAKKESGRRR